MLIDACAPVALFLFAHQDDEFGVFPRIEQELRAGRRVRCVYVTDGAATADSDRRETESINVLRCLGVPKHDILFIGRQLGIGDGQLHLKIGVLADWMRAFLDAQPILEVCFAPAWEGGHPDHDVLHAVCVVLLLERNSLAKMWQYPLYNGFNCWGPFFRVQSPLLENGHVDKRLIGWVDRLRYTCLCLGYPSQWRTWIGLFPFVFIHYVFSGAQQLQKVNRTRLTEPPHARPLYYESRGFLDWPTLLAALDPLLLGNPPDKPKS